MATQSCILRGLSGIIDSLLTSVYEARFILI